MIASAVAVSGLITATVCVAFAIHLPASPYPAGFTTSETIQSWSCKWQSIGSVNATSLNGGSLGAPSGFSTICKESRAGFILLCILIGLEVIMGIAAVAGHLLDLSVAKKRKMYNMEAEQFVMEAKHWPLRMWLISTRASLETTVFEVEYFEDVIGLYERHECVELYGFLCMRYGCLKDEMVERRFICWCCTRNASNIIVICLCSTNLRNNADVGPIHATNTAAVSREQTSCNPLDLFWSPAVDTRFFVNINTANLITPSSKTQHQHQSE